MTGGQRWRVALASEGLTVAVASLITAHVGVAEGIAVDGEGPEMGIVSGCVVEGASMAGVRRDAALGVHGTVGTTGDESIAFG
jgi:ABC-type xylose transport system permease subunit